MRQAANALTAMRVWNETEFLSAHGDELRTQIELSLFATEPELQMQEWVLLTAVDLLLLGRYLGKPRELAEALIFMATFYAFANVTAARARTRLDDYVTRMLPRETDADPANQAAD